MSDPRIFSSILVTGGAGFIGSNFIRHIVEEPEFKGRIINFNALTYAGNLENLTDMAAQYGSRYVFVRGDIREKASVEKVFADFAIDAVVHFAAESHVDRSILGPEDFITTNVIAQNFAQL